ncbi:unnamed protein product, partial [Amoebophrya sp. A120]|eukprot:GSA120T00017452001.1
MREKLQQQEEQRLASSVGAVYNPTRKSSTTVLELDEVDVAGDHESGSGPPRSPTDDMFPSGTTSLSLSSFAPFAEHLTGNAAPEEPTAQRRTVDAALHAIIGRFLPTNLNFAKNGFYNECDELVDVDETEQERHDEEQRSAQFGKTPTRMNWSRKTTRRGKKTKFSSNGLVDLDTAFQLSQVSRDVLFTRKE